MHYNDLKKTSKDTLYKKNKQLLRLIRSKNEEIDSLLNEVKRLKEIIESKTTVT